VILIVDDNPTDVFLVREAIAAQGIDSSTTVIEDGEDAMKFIEGVEAEASAERPSLILLDINLPRIDGLQVLERVRRSKRCADTPVIVMTSSAAEADRTVASALRADVYFQKPSDYDAFLELGSLIRKLLDSR
jgi:CheY-like chemotaxis protein